MASGLLGLATVLVTEGFRNKICPINLKEVYVSQLVILMYIKDNDYINNR